MTYNGWATYETWLTNIHFYQWDFEDVLDQIADTEPEDELDVRNWLADYIKDAIEEHTTYLLDQLNNPWISDLATTALSEVNFRDLAEHYSADVWADVQALLQEREVTC